MKFKGNFLTNISSNHSVTFTEPYMVYKGIASWNLYTFEAAMEHHKDAIKDIMLEYKETGQKYWNALLEAYDSGASLFVLPEAICQQEGYSYQSWTVVYWSDAAGRNVSKKYTPADLWKYIDYYERGTGGNKRFDKEIDIIKSSVNNCVTFAFGEEMPEKDGQNYKEPWEFTAKLFINDINVDTVPNASDERILLPKHNHMVAMQPRKSTGREFSYRPSAENHLTTSDGDFNTGVNYAAIKNVNDDNTQMIAAGVDYYYDNNTGMYHAGTVQMLGILMEDLPSADIKAPDVDIGDLKNNTVAKSKNWYSKTGQYFTGKYTTAIAMPISMENGNPNTYGPDITLCEGEREIDKVRAVNRSNMKFEKGQTVMLNKINGEWIVTDFGTLSSEPSVAKIGKWGFSKYMANSDCYFRDTNGNRLGPEDAQDFIVDRCWSTLPDGSTLKDINNKGYTPANPQIGINTIKLCKYGQCTSFDYKFNNPKNLIAHEEQTQTEVWEMPLDTFHSYWGPIFTYGYTAGSVSSVEGVTYKEEGDAEGYIDITNLPLSYRDVRSLVNLENGVYQNNRLVHCPPDIAICTYPGSEFGHPIYISEKYIDIINEGVDVAKKFSELTDVDASIREDTAYLWSNEGEVSLVPQNNTSLTWMPLGQCCALGDDVNTHLKMSIDGSNIINNTQNNGCEFRYYRNQTMIANFGEGANVGVMHKFYNRTNFDNYGQPSLATLGAINVAYESSSRFNQNNGGTCIPYFTYLKRTALDRSIHALRIFEDINNDVVGGGNRSSDMVGPGVVGISTARVAIGRRGGGPVNINVGGMYGRTGTGRSTNVEQVQDNGFLGPGRTSVSGGLPKDSGKKPTWGSAADKIYSFGGFNLFAMVWDYWPSDLTFFIPEYFAVLHFNPGQVGSDASHTLGTIHSEEDANGNVTDTNEKIYSLDYESDFRVPTIMDNGYQTYKVEEGELIESWTLDANGEPLTKFAPTEFWHVDTSRRGLCVTNGYYYSRIAVGLGDDWELRSQDENGNILVGTPTGTGFGAGDVIQGENGVIIEVIDVDENGGIRDFKFKETTVGSFTYKERGSDFTPASFPKGDPETEPPIPNGRLVYFDSTSPNGTPATILWKSGIGYEQIVYSEGVQRRDGITSPKHISPGSGAGNATVGEKWGKFDWQTQLDLSPNANSAGEKDQYEVFFYCVNDVDIVPEQQGTVALVEWNNGQIGSTYQSYMTMDLS